MDASVVAARRSRVGADMTMMVPANAIQSVTIEAIDEHSTPTAAL